MALFPCSECGKFISDKAVACPGCGCPVSMAIIQPTSCPAINESDSVAKKEDSKIIENTSVSVYEYNNDDLSSLNQYENKSMLDLMKPILILAGGVCVVVALMVPHVGIPMISLVFIGRFLMSIGKN